MSHDLYENIKEMEWSAREITLAQVYNQAKSDLGDNALLEFDRDIATIAKCTCGHKKDVFSVVNRLKNEDIICENCCKTMQFETIHTICGDENYLGKTLYEIGIPLFHIISARNGIKYTYYELTKDKEEILRGLI